MVKVSFNRFVNTAFPHLTAILDERCDSSEGWASTKVFTCHLSMFSILISILALEGQKRCKKNYEKNWNFSKNLLQLDSRFYQSPTIKTNYWSAMDHFCSLSPIRDVGWKIKICGGLWRDFSNVWDRQIDFPLTVKTALIVVIKELFEK